jgi:FkbM family methyltransferase
MADRLFSFAQQGEDVVLWRAFRDQPCGFYVDVGAHDPVQDSVTKLFYDRGWRGINIEPQVAHFERLCEDRPRDINLNLAVDGRAGRRLLHEVPASSGLTTFDRELAAFYRDVLHHDVIDRDVEVESLQTIVDCHATEVIDFLKVDVEGSEANVLGSLDWSRTRPRAVLVEATRPAEWEPLLFGAGYQKTLYDGLNNFYVRAEESAALCAPLSVPANVTDDFEIWRHLRQIEDLTAELAASRARLARFDRLNARVPRWLRRPLRVWADRRSL